MRCSKITLFSHSSIILLLRLVLMLRKTEKNLSAVAVVMGIVKNTLISLSISVNMPLADGTFRSISAMMRTLVTVNVFTFCSAVYALARSGNIQFDGPAF